MKRIERVGRYELVREIGRGGMAVVHLARQVELDRMVALKELSRFYAGSPEFAQRFLRESRLAGSLNHPNIVTVLEFFEENGIPYIAMEYIPRGSLRPYMRGLSLAQIAGVLEGVLAGLAHAEAAGIVHRDIKPENIMVAGDGRVKITDFGLARAREQASNVYLTAEGTTVGTPNYMSPEQAMGGEIGPWTDLYSVGIVAYELVAGKLPFRDTDAAMVILMRHVNEPIPPVTSVKPSLDAELSAWIDSLLVKDPGERLRSASAAWESLEVIFVRLLGPLWRRDARLLEPPTGDVPAAPAARESMPSQAPDDTLGTGSFVTSVEPDAGAAPADAAPAAETAPGPAPDGSFQPPSASRDGSGGALPPSPPSVSAAGAARSGMPHPEQTAYQTLHVDLPPGVPVSVRLVDGFRYLHGPLAHDECGVTLLGNQKIVAALKDRLLRSHGGALLITGFRGVGKTTLVMRALEEIRDSPGSAVEYVPVVLSVARPVTFDELLFEVIRRLFEALADNHVLDALDPDSREALLLAYARTSLSFKETASRSRESSQSVNLDLSGLMGAASPALGTLAPRIGLGRKRSDTMAREASFLAYSQADVEHDFMRIVRLLGAATATSPRRRRLIGRSRRPWRGRLVVVLDELDKLTATDDGMTAAYALLTGLKNILTAPDVHFVFVGGPELHDAYIRDTARGNGVYESVFAAHFYVPCVWDAGSRLVGGVIAAADQPSGSSLQHYLDFKARGLPRLLLRELNELVRWNGDRAQIDAVGLDADRLAFYGHLQSLVSGFVKQALDNTLLTLAIDVDRWRLGAYYLTDWILRRGKEPFRVADMLSGDGQPSPLIGASADRVEQLVAHLVAHGIVEELWGPHANQTVIQDAEQAPTYRLADTVIARLASFARGNERERADLDLGFAATDAGAAASPWMAGGSMRALDGGRYELHDLIGVGGVGQVYRALDRRMSREVMIRIPYANLLADENARSRWRREATIATQLNHPNIVRTYDVFEDHDGSAGIVMELLEGPSLRTALPLDPSAAIRVTIDLLAALEHAAEAGLGRFDLKPENVLLVRRRGAVIVEVGLVKPLEPTASAFTTMAQPAHNSRQLLVGTPKYMSPEQALGKPLDVRSDLYCVGLLIYETITGTPVRSDGVSTRSMFAQAANESISVDDLDVSPALQEVVARALSRTPEGRFPTPAAMSAAIRATPEGEHSASLDLD